MPPPVPVGEGALHVDRHGPGGLLGERLRGQDVFDLTRADPEGERAERPVRRGVAVTAHDGHARLGEPELGADDVHDALLRIAHPVEPDARLPAVGLEDIHLPGRDRVLDGLVEPGRRHVVVHRRHGQVGPAHAAAGEAQPLEGLRRRDLVEQVQVDVEQIGLAGSGVHDVAGPDLLGEGRRCSHCGLTI
jgi:hypothetical protein